MTESAEVGNVRGNDMATNQPRTTRRDALKAAATLLGGTIAATQLSSLAARAAHAAAAGEPPEFFDASQFAVLENIVDVMIPATDTPGAHAVGVHHFIDLMMSEWASRDRQTRYAIGMADLEAALDEAGGGSFVDMPADRQLAALADVDAKAFDGDTSVRFYRELKHMVLFSYYSTEAGANEELRYQRLPGVYEPCLTTDDDTRAWFHMGFRHGL